MGGRTMGHIRLSSPSRRRRNGDCGRLRRRACHQADLNHLVSQTAPVNPALEVALPLLPRVIPRLDHKSQHQHHHRQAAAGNNLATRRLRVQVMDPALHGALFVYRGNLHFHRHPRLRLRLLHFRVAGLKMTDHLVLRREIRGNLRRHNLNQLIPHHLPLHQEVRGNHRHDHDHNDHLLPHREARSNRHHHLPQAARGNHHHRGLNRAVPHHLLHQEDRRSHLHRHHHCPLEAREGLHECIPRPCPPNKELRAIPRKRTGIGEAGIT
ncbi:hypothetical protein F4802DRAFT_557793 [Xylaria palmicola]|nr:hypothetical protein F4802DRAFT_557793 [Xylaria palmicola]